MNLEPIASARASATASANATITSGGSRGGAPLFLDQTEARMAEKKTF